MPAGKIKAVPEHRGGGTPLQKLLGTCFPTQLVLSDSDTDEWVRAPGSVVCADGRVMEGDAAYNILEPYLRQYGISLDGITTVDDLYALWQGLWYHDNCYRLGAGIYVCTSYEKFRAHFNYCRFATKSWYEYVHYVGTSNFTSAKKFADYHNLRDQCIKVQKARWKKSERGEKNGENRCGKENMAALIAKFKL